MANAPSTETQVHKSPNYFLVFIVLAGITAAMTAIELLHIEMTTYLQNTLFVVLSIVKATLVAMYYMHLKSDSRVYTILFLMPVFLVLILVIILLI